MKMVRYDDLVEARIVDNRPQLKNLIEKQGFPAGIKLGPNTRAWHEEDVKKWLASRPTDRKPGPAAKDGVVRRKSGRKARMQSSTATAAA